MHAPHFTIRKKFFSQRCYVYVRLPNGEKRKVARFPSAQEAEYWMEFRSQSWLDRHHMELGLTPPTSQAQV
jgi:hypothetical protein